MTVSSLTRLRKLAENATPGPWEHRLGPEDEWDTVWMGPSGNSKGEEYGFEASHDRPQAREDAAFIAAFDPPTVLALLDVAELATTPELKYALAFWRDEKAVPHEAEMVEAFFAALARLDELEKASS